MVQASLESPTESKEISNERTLKKQPPQLSIISVASLKWLGSCLRRWGTSTVSRRLSSNLVESAEWPGIKSKRILRNATGKLLGKKKNFNRFSPVSSNLIDSRVWSGMKSKRILRNTTGYRDRKRKRERERVKKQQTIYYGNSLIHFFLNRVWKENYLQLSNGRRAK